MLNAPSKANRNCIDWELVTSTFNSQVDNVTIFTRKKLQLNRSYKYAKSSQRKQLLSTSNTPTQSISIVSSIVPTPMDIQNNLTFVESSTEMAMELDEHIDLNLPTIHANPLNLLRQPQKKTKLDKQQKDWIVDNTNGRVKHEQLFLKFKEVFPQSTVQIKTISNYVKDYKKEKKFANSS